MLLARQDPTPDRQEEKHGRADDRSTYDSCKDCVEDKLEEPEGVVLYANKEIVLRADECGWPVDGPSKHEQVDGRLEPQGRTTRVDEALQQRDLDLDHPDAAHS